MEREGERRHARSIVDKRQNCFYAMILGLDSRPGIAVLLNVALRKERKRRRDSREGERRGGNTRVHPLMGLVITRAKFYSCLLATARPYPTIICLRLRDEGGRAKKRTGRKSRESREIVFFFLSNSLIPEERKSTHLSPPRRFLLLSTFLAFYEPRPTGFFFTPPNAQGPNKSSRGTIKGFLIVKYCGRVSVFVSHSSGTLAARL